MNTIRTTLAVAPLLCLAILAGAAAAQEQARKLDARASERYGEYLVDDKGRALYLFTKDTQGQGSGTAKSACEGACAVAWPPVTVAGSLEAAGPVKGNLLSTITRADGARQVTYNGWPLYYWIQDRGGEEATGHDMRDFDGEWYLVTPEGEKVQAGEGGAN